MGKKVTVEQVKKVLQCKQYNASKKFTMDVTGLSPASIDRIWMLKKADEERGIDGIFTTGAASEKLRDVVSEALGYTSVDREKAKNRVAAGNDRSTEPERLTLADAKQQSAPDNTAIFAAKMLANSETANAELAAIYRKLDRICLCLESVAKEVKR